MRTARSFSTIASASSSDSVVPTSIHPLAKCLLRIVNVSVFMFIGTGKAERADPRIVRIGGKPAGFDQLCEDARAGGLGAETA